MIRQPIVTVMGHVDHGKTTLLDFIRSSKIAEREAGKITQHVGATEVPLNKIEEICGKMLNSFGVDLEMPGLLFIDTPGHAAFSNLRKRGGSVADIAVLVVDVNQGLQPQTIEAIEILKHHKTPYIIAANKIDVVMGWRSKDTTS
ncbi:MAG: GTP-binding protein, partial [Candidatus Diapherotrites archaeon]|nr:GTP-binding protein [Candidatus Diapherotrites archaeon]